MPLENKISVKNSLHPRNKNRNPYDLVALIKALPALGNYIKPNKLGADSIDFSIPEAVKLLNRALLKHYYSVEYWDFPNENLCPPIPGRADYIHHIADLLFENNRNEFPKASGVRCLDIGTGANCIYPIIGVSEYDWEFIATDIDANALKIAKKIVAKNTKLSHKIALRFQQNHKSIFRGIIETEDIFDVTLCNPPFHSSTEEALKGSQRKVKNISGVSHKKPPLNFSGLSNELVYKGGEIQFIKNMIHESGQFSKNCFWFTSLVSKQSNLPQIYELLNKTKATTVKTIPLDTGNKSSRIIAWTFLSREEQKQWRERRWS